MYFRGPSMQFWGPSMYFRCPSMHFRCLATLEVPSLKGPHHFRGPVTFGGTLFMPNYFKRAQIAAETAFALRPDGVSVCHWGTQIVHGPRAHPCLNPALTGRRIIMSMFIL